MFLTRSVCLLRTLATNLSCITSVNQRCCYYNYYSTKHLCKVDVSTIEFKYIVNLSN